jgi:hypothetical protein
MLMRGSCLCGKVRSAVERRRRNNAATDGLASAAATRISLSAACFIRSNSGRIFPRPIDPNAAVGREA